MNVITQLVAVDALEWALFVAMHLPDPIARRAVVRDLVERHGPAYAIMSPEQHALLNSMAVPQAWLAVSLATLAAYTGNRTGVILLVLICLRLSLLPRRC